MYYTPWVPSTIKSYSSNYDSSDHLISPGRDSSIANEFQEIQSGSSKSLRKLGEPKRVQRVEIEAQHSRARPKRDMLRKVSRKEWISRFRALDILDKQISDAEKSDRTAVFVDIEDLKELREEFEFLHKGVTELARLTDDVEQITIATKRFANSKTEELTRDEA